MNTLAFDNLNMGNDSYTPEEKHFIKIEDVQKDRKQNVPNIGSDTDGNQYLHHQ